MKLPTLESVLQKMRDEIEDKANTIKRVMNPRRFPCPYCQKSVEVQYHPNGLNYRLSHKVPGCQVYEEKPMSNATRNVLLEAFVFHCKPKLMYAPIEGLEVKGENT